MSTPDAKRVAMELWNDITDRAPVSAEIGWHRFVELVTAQIEIERNRPRGPDEP